MRYDCPNMFIDAMIVQYVDDRMRSRVAGIRLAVAFGMSSTAVYLLGPTVKAAGWLRLRPPGRAGLPNRRRRCLTDRSRF